MYFILPISCPNNFKYCTHAFAYMHTHAHIQTPALCRQLPVPVRRMALVSSTTPQPECVRDLSTEDAREMITGSQLLVGACRDATLAVSQLGNTQNIFLITNKSTPKCLFTAHNSA